MYIFRRRQFIATFLLLILFSIFFIRAGWHDAERSQNDNSALDSTVFQEPSVIYESNSNDLYKRFLGQKTRDTSQSKITLGSQRLSTIMKDYYVILEYTKVFSATKFCEQPIDEHVLDRYRVDDKFKRVFSSVGNKERRRYSLLDKCVYKNCFFTCDKTYTHEADALLFHYIDFGNDVKTQASEYKELVRQRDRRQVWILWQDEARGTQSQHDYMKFNWTISFYLNAEVSFYAYGGAMHKNKTERVITEGDIKAEFQKRNSSALWFVSNCNSNYRLKFTSELGKHFPITINGDCKGTFSSDKNLITVDQSPCPRDSNCEASQLTGNKFYLAFESINCSDYITEKFWRSLSYGLIPVVIQPSRESYERIAPPDSFIHAQDFGFDAAKLGEYLKSVASDFSLYLKHLKWTVTFTSLFLGDDNEPRRLCQLCAKLNTERSSIYYESMSKWFERQCAAQR